jgi:hypothetical protein
MHLQHFSRDFKRFIPQFRRSGGSGMTLAARVHRLSSLAAQSSMQRHDKH